MFVDRRVGHAKGDVAPHRVVEQIRILRHVPDEALPCPLPSRENLPVEQHAPAGWLEQAEQHVYQRALARSRLADNAQRFAGTKRQVDMTECGPAFAIVGERHVLAHERAR